jgi:adenylate cyclase
MRIKRRTTFSGPQQPMDHEVSLANVVEFVASPILNPDGEVIGAVYGDRHTNTGGLRRPIEKMDAQLVEILACGIAGGLQRLQKEREAMERRVQFDAFVTPEVASMIEKDPEALSGRDADVTMLFCDIAGFSGISEKLSPTQTFDWINDVMASLSKCVKDHGGTIVDYVGDELIAMWGAPFPTEHEHHAHAASRAAIAMIKSLPGIDAKWQSITQVPTQVGVGLNSGKVRVGNTGCQFKFKYGPLGSTVNIASRIQGATRFLRTPILITGATAELLNDEFPVRRLCKLRVKNIETPIDIFELPTDPRDDWGLRRSDYAVALTAWEQRNLQDAVNSLSQIVATYKDDVPALVMLGRAIEVWSHGHTHYDPVWTLPSK